eukprot:TRINITY_DN107_c0_g1_i2.p2 TRINITY_DN107_c0_g1~~TRINITY_DN107_c0_g1_i2.p2  ORF type:complete len:100 (+),score=16.78 TRINITY_DN107_c0_g1_i2:30-302(+)
MAEAQLLKRGEDKGQGGAWARFHQERRKTRTLEAELAATRAELACRQSGDKQSTNPVRAAVLGVITNVLVRTLERLVWAAIALLGTLLWQ